MTETLHQGFVGLSFAVLGGELEEPLAEERIEGLVLGLGEGAGLLDKVFVGAKSDIFH
jgi:hypothetical protein